MAKNTMNKVSKKVAKMDKSTLAIILVSLALVIVVTVILVRKSKREGFALMDLSNASFVTQGEDGADGAQGVDGAPGVDGANGADGNDYIPSDQDRNNIYSDFKEKDLAENSRLQTELYNSFKNKLMGEMVQNKLIVKEGTDENPKYFPVGVIGMKTIIFSEQLRYNKKQLKEGKAYNVKYNKQSTNSYVKVNYTLNVTGQDLYKGCQLKIYAKGTGNNEGTLIRATGGGAVGELDWHWDEIAATALNVTGIDYTPQTEQRQYYLKIYLTNNNLCVNNLFKPEWQNFDINKLGHLRSSVTVEEIVLPDFNKDNIKSLEMTDLVPDIG